MKVLWFEISTPSRYKDDGRVVCGWQDALENIVKYSFAERKLCNWTWKVNEDKVIPLGRKVIEEYQPDIIHVFGNEWPFGLLAQYTDITLVIHIQDSIVPYSNAQYPPGYNEFTFVKAAGFNLRKIGIA